MSSMFCIARVYSGVNPPGYELSSEALTKIAADIVGAPITFEHAGIVDAIRGTDGLSVRDKLARLALIHPERGVLGSVVEMFPVGTIWYVIFTLDLEAAIWLVSSKLIRGVSLSHLAPDIPLEVSITTSPARPLCYIEKSGTLSEILEYKRFILSSIPRDNMAHLKEILDKLDATDREAIESRLTLIQGKLEDAQKTLTEKEEATCAAEAKAADAESKLETAEKTMQSFQLTAASDAARLRQEVSTLKAHIDPEILENCSLSEKTLESLYNDNPHEVRRCLDRVLVAANTQMMRMKNGTLLATPSKKRRVEEVEDSSSPLERALADTFECH